MNIVKLRKLSAHPEAKVPTPAWAGYPLGTLPPDDISVPVAYEMTGYLLCPVVVGGNILLMRTSRNGVCRTGFFRSSQISEINEQRIVTQNSIYVLHELENTEPPIPKMNKKTRSKPDATVLHVSSTSKSLNHTAMKNAEVEAKVTAVINRTAREITELGGDRVDFIRAMSRAAKHVYGPKIAEKIERNIIAFEIVRLRSIGCEDEILAEEGGSISVKQFAKLLGVSIETVRKHQEKKAIFSVLRDQRLLYPAWQVYEKNLLPGLCETLTALEDLDPIGRALYFLTPTERFDDKRPLDLLRAGMVKDVVANAKHYVDRR